MAISLRYRPFSLLGGLWLVLALAGCHGVVGGGGGSAPAASHSRFAFTGDGDGTVSVFGINGKTLRYGGYAVIGRAAVLDLAVAPDQGHLYVLAADGTLGAYGIDAGSGALTRVNAVTVSGGAVDILLSADGRFLYTVNSAANSVSTYAVSSTTGGLSVAGSSLKAGASPLRIALAPSGAFAYVLNRADQSVSIYTRDKSTGTLTLSTTTSLPAKPTALALNKAGTFAYIIYAAATGNVGVYGVDGATGDLSPVQTVTAGDTPADIVLDANDAFAYVAGTNTDRVDVFRIDAANGRLTSVQSMASAPDPRDLTLSPDGQYLYAATFADDALTTYAVDGSTGRLARVDDTRTRAGLNAVALASGASAYSVRAAYLFAPDGNVHAFPADAATGALGAPASEAAGTNPVQVALRPDNRYAYVVNSTSNTLSVFAFDTTSGTLGALVETDQAPSEWRQNLPMDITRAAIDPSGRFLYLLDHRGTTALNGRIAAYTIDPASGGLTYQGQVSSGDLNPMDLVMHPAGHYIYAINTGGNSIAAFAIDPATGTLTQSNSFQAGQSGAGRPIALAFTPNGRYAYATLESDQQLVRYDVAANGDLTHAAAVDITAGEVPTDPRPRSIAVDPSGRYAYVSHWSGDVSTWTIDPGTYALTFAGTAAVGSLPDWVTLDPNGRFAYTVVTGGVTRLSVGTGGTLSLQDTTSTGTGNSTFRTATIVSVIQ